MSFCKNDMAVPQNKDQIQEIQQWESFLAWFKRGGKYYIYGAVALCVLALLAWVFYSYRVSKAHADSEAFAKLMDAYQEAPLKTTNEIQAFAVGDHGVYSLLAKLIQAHNLVDEGNLQAAMNLYNTAAYEAKDSLKPFVFYQIALMNYSVGATREAIQILESQVENSALRPIALLTKGDIYFLSGKSDEARIAYDATQIAYSEAGLNTNRVQARLRLFDNGELPSPLVAGLNATEPPERGGAKKPAKPPTNGKP